MLNKEQSVPRESFSKKMTTSKSTVLLPESSQKWIIRENESYLEDQVSIMDRGQISPRDYDSEKSEIGNSASALSTKRRKISDMQKKCVIDIFGDDALVNNEIKDCLVLYLFCKLKC